MSKLLLYILLPFWIFAAPEWGTNLENAFVKAEEENKLILLNFSGSDWCGPCIMMHRNLFDSREFVQYADEHLELVKADFPRKKANQLSVGQTIYNENLAERYNPNGTFPLTLLLSPEGEVLHAWKGYSRKLKTEEFIATIQENVLH